MANILQPPRRPVILCFVSYYLPGFRSGGPARSISNFVDHFSDRFDIHIVTRDRDIGDRRPYPSAQPGQWKTCGKCSILYCPSSVFIAFFILIRLLKDSNYDILYLNSFFDFRFSVVPLLARWLRLVPIKPCVIAPRGEFSKGALALKPLKKHPYMFFFRNIPLCNSLTWQASSAMEAQDIQREMCIRSESIRIASNLPPRILNNSQPPIARYGEPLRLIFLSRITPKKNLDYLLNILSLANIKLSLDIYGPIEDNIYWSECESLIRALPPSINVIYRGVVEHSLVIKCFADYDLFVFPTRGENFGHVILDSLSAGTPVIVSDQTPWQPDDSGGLHVLPLNDMQSWVTLLESWPQANPLHLHSIRLAAFNLAQRYSSNTDLLANNLDLFEGLLRNAV